MNNSNTQDVTQDGEGNPIVRSAPAAVAHPRRIGRYRIENILGQGGFGLVYRAHDEKLDRDVAIKVPHARLTSQKEDAEAYLNEARTVANLDHPGIVPVYDVGSTDNCVCYVVSKFIDGVDLSKKLLLCRFTYWDSADLVATVAEALHFAHKHGFVHRDVKPGNVLIGTDGKVYVVDFGLALREQDFGKGPRYAGTPAYMSPEQAQGEGHRVDGRSDIFSLGIVFYELLIGRRPFESDSQQQLLEQIVSVETRPLRQVDDNIPRELERICLKALSRRASERYTTAMDMAEDLRQWLETQRLRGTKPETGHGCTTSNAVVNEANAGQAENSLASDSQPVAVVPKGLRSFDAGDADFFPDLLPGPRNRDGLPESLHFWKTRIESRDKDNTFPVGLIYGPSGCGKSSLVKAGLLPHLSKDVVAIYVEATPDDTETRILRGLRKHDSTLANIQGLASTLTALRRSQGRKVVIIIDQFEQWLHAHRAEPDAELVKALRQCDGGCLQALLMVRDDFSVAAARLMAALDIRIVQGENFALVDLFDVDHAAKVLTRLGQAFGKLPAKSGELSAGERQFIRSVVEGLAQDGKVVSVRLSLFAEMVKGKSWTPKTLDQLGGTRGIGVNFLDETFSSPQANPRHSLYAAAARRVLKTLLPDSGTDIKGHMRPQVDLLEASGYRNSPSEFAELLRILDSELRLITPTDPEGASAHERESTPNVPQEYYQLTHDYLVPSIREWLNRKQKETRRGRAELQLAELSAMWNAKPESRHLPSLTEWLSILAFTESKHWTASERALIRQAGRMHRFRTSLVAVAILTLVFVGLATKKAVDRRQAAIIAQKQEEQNQAEAARLVEGLLIADTAQVNTIIVRLKEFREWAVPLLRQAFETSADDSISKLHAGLALKGHASSNDPEVLRFLQERLLTATPTQIGPMLEMLESHKVAVTPAYWQLLTNENSPKVHRFHAACALAAFDPTSDVSIKSFPGTNAAQTPVAKANANIGWNDPTVTQFVAEQLVAVSSANASHYLELFRPVASKLVPDLSAIFEDPVRGELTTEHAASILADFASDDPDTLVDLILVSDPTSDKTLFPVLLTHQPTCVEKLETVLDRRLEPAWNDFPPDPMWSEPSAEIRNRIESAHGLITDRFAFCSDLNWQDFLEVAESLRSAGYRPVRICPYLVASSTATIPVISEEKSDAKDDGDPSFESPQSTLVAVIWNRDGKTWELQRDITREQFFGTLTAASRPGFLLTDVVAVPGPGLADEPLFLAIWTESLQENEVRRVILDVSEGQFKAKTAKFANEGFANEFTLKVRTDASGQRYFTGLFSNQGTPSELGMDYAGFERADVPQWDVSVRPSANQSKLAPPKYAALWKADVQFESKLLLSVPVESIVEKIQPFLTAGFRPFAISNTAIIPSQLSGNDTEKTDLPETDEAGLSSKLHSHSLAEVITCSIVLHRPLIPDASKEKLALQQAAAATALLRMNASEKVWPLFQHQPDPRLSSYLLDRLTKFHTDPQALLTRLSGEPNESRARNLILALGEFAKANMLSVEQKQLAIVDLANRYANETDPGVHSAAEWSLRQLGAADRIEAIRLVFSTGDTIGDRRWYLSKRRRSVAHVTQESPEASDTEQDGYIPGHAMAIIDADDEFMMGSPVFEFERFGGPMGKDETRHRRRINRQYAIGMHEVTVAQFAEFRGEHKFDRIKAREIDAPANGVSWYDAAAYCNWLSEREGIPQEEWCYESDAAIRDAMISVPDYLHRTGYRLPTEAEWEYACRAGTATARFFGETETLLGEYAWYSNSSEGKWMLPVGTLKPNGVGLFDVLGNAIEWSQGTASIFDSTVEFLDDREQIIKLSSNDERIVRGGSFSSRAPIVRSASRIGIRQDDRNFFSGFRVSRTLQRP
jgi:serine/threonine protein kinase/formylglycine-generating enzyme required for sulfatase activity